MSGYDRRLSDKLLIAFDQTCEQQDVEAARRLLALLDFLWQRDAGGTPERRGSVNFLLSARERFRHLVYLVEQRNRSAIAAAGRREAYRPHILEA